MRRWIVTPSIAIALAAGVAVAGSASAAPPAVGAATAHYSQTAYPQTKPSAGQFCKKAHRGVVTTAANGRKVRCTAEGSRSRWKYVK
jgi:ABC-type phosphate transport system substrate-binding protein